jgi:hypothetical protein
MKPSPVRIDVSRQELEDVLERVRETLGKQDYEKLKAAIETLAYLTDSLQDREISLQRLRKHRPTRTRHRNRRPRGNPRTRRRGRGMVVMRPRRSEERRRSKSPIAR